MPAAIKSAETAMRLGDPNSAHLNGERLAEVPPLSGHPEWTADSWSNEGWAG